MPAYNFKPQFADMVEDGKKRQTIRPRRKRPTQVGDTLYFYTGMRTRNCRKLGEWVCQDVVPVDIYDHSVYVDGVRLGFLDTVELAEEDGFEDASAFFNFFKQTYGLPLVGRMELIKW